MNNKLALTAVVFLIAVLLIPTGIEAYDFSSWSHGASGYSDVIRESEIEEKPVVLYFHTEWCGWSKKMNNDYLATYALEDFLSYIPKVEINPETGGAEKSLQEKYNVTGYPTFLVFIPSINSTPSRLYPFLKDRSDMSTDEFIEAFQEKVAYQYNTSGIGYYRSQQYDKALKQYEMSLRFGNENAYAYYGKGLVYHKIAYRDKDTGRLELAERSYMKALEIDPAHQPSRKQLEAVRKSMEQLGVR